MAAFFFAAIVFFAWISVVGSLPSADCTADCPALPVCVTPPDLLPDGSFPAGKSAAEACGRLERRLTRFDDDDEKFNLVQYLGEDVVFVNEENTNTWCGNETRLCVNCENGQPAATDERKNVDQCADRLMTGRLHSRLKVLQRLAAKKWPKRKTIFPMLRSFPVFFSGRVRVSEAWEEPTSTDPAGIHPLASLHYEGRSARLDISIDILPGISVPDRDTDVSLLTRLGGLAVCAGFDHVYHSPDGHLTVSVRQQKDRHGNIIVYPSGATFLQVEIPTGYENDYTISGKEASLLVDSDGRLEDELSGHFKVKDVLSLHSDTGKAFRYFRLSPGVLYCLESVYNEVEEGRLEIVSAYRTKTDNDGRRLPDKEGRLHAMGLGIEVRIIDSTTKAVDLAVKVVEQCGSSLAAKGESLGVILLQEGIYFDVRSAPFSSTGPNITLSKSDFQQKITDALNSADRRISAPEFLSEAVCDYKDTPSAPQSPNYKHIQSVQGLCPEEDTETEFCSISQKARTSEINRLWKVISLKHFLREKADVQQAFEQCFLLCSPCTEGAEWNKKTEACDNFVHWSPISLSDQEDKSNVETHFYALNNQKTRAKACARSPCLHQTEMLTSLGPLLQGEFYREELSMHEEKLYSREDNPNPLLDIIHKTYAMHATGKATVWISSVQELASLNQVFKALMVYNEKITEVEIKYDEERVAKDNVASFMRNAITQWAKTSCQRETKDTVTTYQAVPY
eukprot:m.3444 g.3444  ORF g.3444 m.3444 type:complete len:736 (+) comp9384_c0_seq2:31-2238(+)